MPDRSTLAQNTYDLIAIGGGINGAGIARDAALRGLKTLLIEKLDFGGGTTSWSTRLIHGGLRYLEHFEFGLVRESLREREILLRIAPHLVKPLPLTIPVYRSGSRAYWEIQAGMLLYDLLSYDKTLPTHRLFPAATFHQVFRSVNVEALTGAAQYYDAQVEYAERLCLETVQSAQAAGADVLNYTQVVDIQRQGDIISHLVCRDALEGDQFAIAAGASTVVVNASGPWVDAVCGIGSEGGRPSPLSRDRAIGGTKGSHIVVAPFPGAPDTALYVEAHRDGRPFFVVPWLGLYLIGTTDIRYDGDLDRVKATNDEIDYLLAETNRVLPTAGLGRADVLFTYSGVRPLPYSTGKTVSSITRRHILKDHQPDGVANLISLVGGKLTTHRSSAREMVDAVYRKLGRSAPPCPTAEQPLPGAIQSDDPLRLEMAKAYSDRLPAATVHHLFALYGQQTPRVLALGDEAPELLEPILAGQPDIKAQIVYAVRHEFARTLVDITRRRTALAIRCQYGDTALPVLADILARYCGWSAAECDRQIAAHHAYMQANCIPDYALPAIVSTPDRCNPPVNRQEA